MTQGMPEPGEKLTMAEAARSLAELAKFPHGYPLDSPYNVEVTLTDEQWVAVCAGIGALIVHSAIDGAPQIFPDWVDVKLREAIEAIQLSNAVAAVIHAKSEGAL